MGGGGMPLMKSAVAWLMSDFILGGMPGLIPNSVSMLRQRRCGSLFISL